MAVKGLLRKNQDHILGPRNPLLGRAVWKECERGKAEWENKEKTGKWVKVQSAILCKAYEVLFLEWQVASCWVGILLVEA